MLDIAQVYFTSQKGLWRLEVRPVFWQIWQSWSLDAEAFADMVGFSFWDHPSAKNCPRENDLGYKFIFLWQNCFINGAHFSF